MDFHGSTGIILGGDLEVGGSLAIRRKLVLLPFCGNQLQRVEDDKAVGVPVADGDDGFDSSFESGLALPDETLSVTSTPPVLVTSVSLMRAYHVLAQLKAGVESGFPPVVLYTYRSKTIHRKEGTWIPHSKSLQSPPTAICRVYMAAILSLRTLPSPPTANLLSSLDPPVLQCPLFMES